tara:strand:+ start:1977 stop:2537 length:561 start_codon:yes stop_codon:yes gene_type:complete
MADLSNEFMDGPIPGESLTKELGGEPHERPPMYTDPEEVYDFLVEKITSDKVMEKISVSVQLGVPAELVVRAITFVGWAEGYYSIDNMVLVLGPITELTFAILDKSGIDYEKLAPRKQDATLEVAYRKLARLKGDAEEINIEEELPEESMSVLGVGDEDVLEEVVDDIPEILDATEEPGGLMSRRE